MKKELRPFHDLVSCDICGRTILKGERAESYLATGAERKLVCDLCADRALHEGWIRESAHGDLPAGRRHAEQRGALFGRLRRRGRPTAADADELAADDESHEISDFAPERGTSVRAVPLDPAHESARERPKDPRHVRAVPTNAEVKVERALELFNDSEHPRTIAGIMRTLGDPWVAAEPNPEAASEVEILIAWELSWYRYRVDLGDAGEPVTLLDKGEELDQLGPQAPDWNAQAAQAGTLALGVGSRP